MNNRITIKDITIGALLTALAIVIPIIFGPYKLIIGPFTATLGSHVPLFISMAINPTVAIMVGIGSTIGFLLTAPLIVAARAAMHIIVGGLGAYLIQKKFSYIKAFAIVMPVHAILEALVVLPFGWGLDKALYIVGIGTALHHSLDAIIALSILVALKPYLKPKTVRV